MLRDLVRTMSATAPRPTRQLAVLGHSGEPEAPELCRAHCLEGCAASIAERGCAWLRSVAAGAPDPQLAPGGTCEKGFTIAARPFTAANRSGFLVGVCDGPGTEYEELLARLAALARTVEQVGALLAENDGLANEVLGSYEQLNLIFDFTNCISRITDAFEIERLLLRRIGMLLRSDQLYAVHADGRRFGYDVGRDAALADEAVQAYRSRVEAEIAQVRSTRTVAVRADAHGRTLLGPLTRLDGAVDVVIATRPADGPDFNSGDMLVLESLLSFGGQIIANCELHEQLRRFSVETTRALVSAIDKKDHYTSGHSERVGFLARLVGEGMNLSKSEVEVLEWTGLLHDVGKIGVREEILNKEGPLTAEEFELIKMHPEMGYEILKPIASFEIVLDGVLYHHENPDGSGYPAALKGAEIPLAARIVHVVDVFDALSSNRSYRPAFTIERAMRILREEAGTKLDADVVNVFIQSFLELPKRDPETYKTLFSHLRSESE